MNKLLLITSSILISLSLNAQITGYYNGTADKKGEALKSALNEIIKGHVDFSYSDAKYILNYADEDPNNTNNLIQFYTNRSVSKSSSWGTGGDKTNREHIWAKSHGTFADIRPMDGDAHNLHAADGSTNVQRSNYDFSDVVGGTYIAEADAYFNSSTDAFEPADRDKGAVARTIFYMAVRYEGLDGEMDLEVVDALSTYPKPEHGKLSTLLEWNKTYPPTDFERRRNERVFESQRNRNPFIDYPEFADLIWGDQVANPISIDALTMIPKYPTVGTKATISVEIVSTISSQLPNATLYWDTQYNGETHSNNMTSDNLKYSGNIDFSGMTEGTVVYYKVVAQAGAANNILRGTYRLPKTISLTDISAVQGTSNASPMSGQTVTVAGIITSNFDGAYYIQSSTAPNSGICIYDIERGHLGDSVVVTGQVTEYNGLTEIQNVSDTYIYPKYDAPTPAIVKVSDINESYEGMLVTMENVTFQEGGTVMPYDAQNTYHITQGANSIFMYNRYNSRLGGKELPSGTVNVTGVVSQYNNDYQILINSIDDIKMVADNDAPTIVKVTALDKDWVQVDFNEKLNKESAEAIGNYSFNNGITVVFPSLYNETSVLILVTGISAKDYTLTVNGVTDLQGNVLSNATFNFTSNISNGVNNIGENQFSIYPNPITNNSIQIKTAKPMQAVTVLSLTGARVYSQTVSNERELTIPVSNFTNGIFLVRVMYENGAVYTQRVIKQ